MACYNPLKAVLRGGKTGKRELVFKGAKDSRNENVLDLPCGKCVGCKKEYTRQWAVRCVNEASLYESNCFITLTYDEEHLPYGGSLDKDEFTLFMKRLRKKCGNGIRFYQCGEYGEKLLRPHHHLILFNYDFEDKILYSENNGNRLYISKSLTDLWKNGFTSIGSVSVQSVSYVARYVMKKIHGEEADEHYNGLVPEYTTMSRRPGIGKRWYEKYKYDIYPEGEMVVDGRKCKPPRYYDSLYEKEDPEEFKKLKEERKKKSENMLTTDFFLGKKIKVSENDSYRLAVKEFCTKYELEKLKRPLEVVK